MYTIYADNVCIFNDIYDYGDMLVETPKLTLADNSAGSLQFTLPPTNIGYDAVTRLLSVISVRKHGIEVWAGRVMSDEKDFWNSRRIFCEGELAFLNDVSLTPNTYENITAANFLSAIISSYNARAAQSRRFVVGITDVEGEYASIATEYESAWDCINGKLLNVFGGHLIIRKENGVRYLDYVSDDWLSVNRINSQKIEFAKNLVDFKRAVDSTEYATVIIPLGKQIDDAYLTVADVNGGSIYVEDQTAISSFGRIEKIVRWDEVEDASELLELGQAYLASLQFDMTSIELSALDLHYLDVNAEDIWLLDRVEIVSRPHNVDQFFTITKLDIPLDTPEDTVFEAGYEIKTALTDISGEYRSPSGGGSYVLPVASASALGGVQPVNKTSAMIKSVGVDSFGGLWTESGKILEITQVSGDFNLLFPTSDGRTEVLYSDLVLNYDGTTYTSSTMTTLCGNIWDDFTAGVYILVMVFGGIKGLGKSFQAGNVWCIGAVLGWDVIFTIMDGNIMYKYRLSTLSNGKLVIDRTTLT